MSTTRRPSNPPPSDRVAVAISKLPQGGLARWPTNVPYTSNLGHVVPILIEFTSTPHWGLAFEAFMVDPYNTSLQTLKNLVREIFLRSKAQGNQGNILNGTMSEREGIVEHMEAGWREDKMGVDRLKVHEGNVEAVLCLLGACGGAKTLKVEMS